MKKTFSLIIFILLISAVALFLLKSQLYIISLPNKLPENYHKELSILAKESLKSDDVPVSAILLYDYGIIGRGYNTVIKDGNAGGHAEINAISDAIKKTGFKEFSMLDKEKLELITTFEPCPMCKGAIQEYGIKKVEFVKQKTITHWLSKELGDLYYELNKKRVDGRDLQDSLFKMHPAYEQQLK